MPNVVPMQTNFTGGEISPLLAGRVDFSKFAASLATCKNFIPTIQGAAIRRPGFEYLAETKDSSSVSVLVQFVYSNGDAYVLEFGNLYIRFFKDGVLITQVGRKIPTTYEVITTYTSSDVTGLRFCQSADVLFILHPDFAVAQLTRFEDAKWELEDFSFTGGPFMPENKESSDTIAASLVTGSGITLTRDGISILDNTEFDTDPIGNEWTNEGDDLVYDGGADTVYVTIPGAGTQIGSMEQPVSVVAGKTYSLSTSWTIVKVVGPPVSSNVYCKITVGTTSFGDDIFYNRDSDSYTGTIDFKVPDGITTVYVGVYLYAKYDCTVTCSYVRVVPAGTGFMAGHVGALWRLGQREYDDIREQSFTAVADGTGFLEVDNQTFLVLITGTWVGTITLQQSFDGAQWTDFKDYTGNVSLELPEPDRIFYRLSCTAYTSGTAVASLKTVNAIPKGEVEITAVANPFSATADVTETLAGTAATSVWWEGAWSDYRGHPTQGGFYDDRLILTRGLTVYGSQVGDYTNFAVSDQALASDSIQFQLLSRQQNEIHWLEPFRRLMVGTIGSEWWISGAGGDRDPLTPASIRAKQDSFHGSANVTPVKVAHALLFLQRDGKILREQSYQLENDSFVSRSLSILAEHLTTDYDITQLAYQQYPHSVVWALLADGTLLSLTYAADQEVTAWARHETDGEFESICVIPGDDADELWAVVKRTIDGNTLRYVERMTTIWDDATDADDAKFVDCWVTKTGSDITNITGLDYLEGESVSVLIDGATVETHTVASGEITTTESGDKFQIGLAYTSDLETQSVITNSQNGTNQGVMKQIVDLTMRFYQTLGGQFGYDSDNLENIQQTRLSVTTTPVTSDISEIPQNNVETPAKTFLRQADPLPMTVIALIQHVETSTNT